MRGWGVGVWGGDCHLGLKHLLNNAPSYVSGSGESLSSTVCGHEDPHTRTHIRTHPPSLGPVCEGEYHIM